MVQRFAAEGARVHIADLNESPGAELLAGLGGTGHAFHKVDISEPSAARGWIDGVAADQGRVDVLVNNAGIIRDNRIENITREDWDAVLASTSTVRSTAPRPRSSTCDSARTGASSRSPR